MNSRLFWWSTLLLPSNHMVYDRYSDFHVRTWRIILQSLFSSVQFFNLIRHVLEMPFAGETSLHTSFSSVQLFDGNRRMLQLFSTAGATSQSLFCSLQFANITRRLLEMTFVANTSLQILFSSVQFSCSICENCVTNFFFTLWLWTTSAGSGDVRWRIL